jgi:hypothetical protein
MAGLCFKKSCCRPYWINVLDCTLLAQTSAQAPQERQRERISDTPEDRSSLPDSTSRKTANFPRATSVSKRVV